MSQSTELKETHKYVKDIFGTTEGYLLFFVYNSALVHSISPCLKVFNFNGQYHPNRYCIPVLYTKDELYELSNTFILKASTTFLNNNTTKDFLNKEFKCDEQKIITINRDILELKSFNSVKLDYTTQYIYYFLEKSGYGLNLPVLECLSKRFFICKSTNDILDRFISYRVYSYIYYNYNKRPKGIAYKEFLENFGQDRLISFMDIKM